MNKTYITSNKRKEALKETACFHLYSIHLYSITYVKLYNVMLETVFMSQFELHIQFADATNWTI